MNPTVDAPAAPISTSSAGYSTFSGTAAAISVSARTVRPESAIAPTSARNSTVASRAAGDAAAPATRPTMTPVKMKDRLVKEVCGVSKPCQPLLFIPGG
eukprot:scaffold11554_cov98-Isochrysis_galbana.AAC.7